MSEQEFGSTPPPPESTHGPVTSEPAWSTHTPPYTQPAQPPYVAPPGAQGLSENTACALAYITFIPAIIFLLVPPYNASAKIRFHAIQELGLSVVIFVLSFFLIIPILGLIVYFVGGLALLVMWILCIIKASQGGAFKLPLLGNFAEQQSGYRV